MRRKDFQFEYEPQLPTYETKTIAVFDGYEHRLMAVQIRTNLEGTIQKYVDPNSLLFKLTVSPCCGMNFNDPVWHYKDLHESWRICPGCDAWYSREELVDGG